MAQESKTNKKSQKRLGIRQETAAPQPSRQTSYERVISPAPKADPKAFTDAFGELGVRREDTDFFSVGSVASGVQGSLYNRGQSYGPDVLGGLETNIQNLQTTADYITSGAWRDDPIISQAAAMAFGEDYDPDEVEERLLASVNEQIAAGQHAYGQASARSGDTSVRRNSSLDQAEMERLLRLAGYDGATVAFEDNPEYQRMLETYLGYTRDDLNRDLDMLSAYMDGRAGISSDNADLMAAAERVSEYTGTDVLTDMERAAGSVRGPARGGAGAYRAATGGISDAITSRYDSGYNELATEYNRAAAEIGMTPQEKAQLAASGFDPSAEGTEEFDNYLEYIRRGQLQSTEQERVQAQVDEVRAQVRDKYPAEQLSAGAAYNPQMWSGYEELPNWFQYTFNGDWNDPASLRYNKSGINNQPEMIKAAILAIHDEDLAADLIDRYGDNGRAPTVMERYNANTMSQEDQNMFLYLWDTEGQEAAMQYLDDISFLTDMGVSFFTQEVNAALADSGWGGALLANAGSLASVYGRAAMLPFNLYRAATGEEISEYDPSFLVGRASNAVRGTTGQNIDEALGNFNILGWNVGSGVYNAGMSMLESWMMAPMGAGVGSAFLGSVAGNDAMMSALENGRSTRDAAIDGFFAAAIETGFEHTSLEKLFGDVGNPWRNLFTQGMTESLEELGTEAANIALDTMRYGDTSELAMLYNSMLAMGYGETAATEVVKHVAGRLWDAWAGGFVSGTMGGAVSSASTAYGDYTTGKNIVGNNGLNGLLDLAASMKGRLPGDVVSMIDDMQRAIAAQQQAETASTEIDTTEATDSEQTAEAAVEAVEEQQTEVEQEAAPAEEQAVEAEQAAEEQTTEEQAVEETVSEQLDRTSQETSEMLARESDAESARLAEESNREWLEYLQQMEGQQQTEGQEQTQETQAEIQQQEEQDTQEAVEEAVSTEQLDQVRETEQAAETEGAALAEAQSTEVQSRQSSDKVPKVSAAKVGRVFREVMRQLDADAQGVVIDNLGRYVQQMLVENGYTGDRTNLRVLSNKILRLNAGQQLSELELADIQKSPAAVAVVNDLTARVDDYNATQLKKIGLEAMAQPQAKNAKPVTGKAAQQYLSEQGGEYTPAEATTMQRNYHEGQDAVAYAAQFRTAYEYGQEGRNLDVVKGYEGLSELNDAQIGIAYELGRAARNSEQQTAPKSVGKTVGTVDTTAIRGMQLNAAQHASVNFLSKLAKTAGFNVRFVATSANAKGQFTEENGSYNKATRTITIDVNAGRLSTDSFNYAMVHTAAHELTHYIKDFADANLYKAYQEFVFGHLSGKMTEAELNRRIDQTIAANKKLNKELSREEAIDEIVADASADVLSKMTEQDMQQLAEQNPSLLKRIKSFIQRWVKGMKALLKTALSGQQTSNELAQQMEDVIDEQYAKWMEMFKNATENARKADAEADGTVPDQAVDVEGEIQFSLRYDSDLMDKAEAYNAKHELVDPADMEKARADRAMVADFMNDDSRTLNLPKDVKGNTAFGNASYGYSEENTTICPRSLGAEAFIDAVSEYLGRPLTVAEQVKISQDVIGAANIKEPQCVYCYVAADRAAYREFLGKYIEQRDMVIDALKNGETNTKALYERFLDGRKDTDNMKSRFNLWVNTYKSGQRLLSAADLANIGVLTAMQSDKFKQLSDKNYAAQMKDALAYAQSASWAKKRVNYIAYNGHILKWTQKRVNDLNNMYGLRMYSFSDFSPAFALENMQMVTDAAARGLKMLAYTKVPAFVEIFASTGMNINVSVFATEVRGDNGNSIVENNLMGADWAAAQKLRSEHENVGITFVATNDAQVDWALDQDWIDVVIPYHLVRTGRTIAEIMKYKDFTGESSDTKNKGWSKEAGNLSSIPAALHNNDKATYMRLLEENNLEPRFARFVDHPNYMKLVNETRQSVTTSQPVRPIFKADAAINALQDMANNGGYYVPIGGSEQRMYELADEFAGKIRAGEYAETQETGDVQYSARGIDAVIASDNDSLNQVRDPSTITDREILANAMDSMAETQAELDWVQRYRKHIGELNDKQQQMDDINADIVRMTNEDPKGNRDEIIRQKNRAKILASQIDRYDKQLLEFEAGKPLKAVVQRERTKLTEQYRERAARQIAARKESAKQREAQQRERYNEILSEMRTKHKAEMSALRSEKNQKISELRKEKNAKIEALKREKYAAVKEVREEKNESFARQKYLARVQKDAATLREWLTHPTNKAHVPEFLRKPLGAFMDTLDFSSQSMLNGKAETNADQRMIDAMNALHIALAKAHSMSEGDYIGFVDLPGEFLQTFHELTNSINNTLKAGQSANVAPINRMTSAQLKALSEAISTLNTSIRQMNSLLVNARYKKASDASHSTMREMDNIRERIARFKVLEKISDLFNWKNTTPFYAFKRFGEGGKAIFEGLMSGWDKLATNTNAVVEFTKDAYKPKEVREWSHEIHTVELNGREVRMTTAQIMSLYCLNRRAQGRQHLLGGGVRIGEIDAKGKNIRQAQNHMLHEADIDRITGLLTARQIEVANTLQEYMSTVCAEWGNVVSMQRFGYEMFTESNYFPIETDPNNRKAVDEQAREDSLFRLLNLSATKGLVKGANNAVILRDIFDVFASHTTDMAKYNALALPILDMIKWYNYVEKSGEEGDTAFETNGTRKAIEKAFGGSALSYVRNFLKDLNSERDGGRNDNLVSKMIGNSKIAAVGANLRVYALQMTSLPRAAYAIDLKYLLAASATTPIHIRKSMREVRNNVGIAQWKALGFYDTNIARNVRGMIKHDDNIVSKLREWSMTPAGIMDNMTMAIIYDAVRMEMRDKHPNIKVGSEQYTEQVNSRVREIVYQTQVVDSTLTRSDLMRSKGIAPLLTAYMSEPTLTMNMLNDSLFEMATDRRRDVRNGWMKPTAAMSKALGLIAFTGTMAALVQSLFSALRDDDEFETFGEKFRDAFFGAYTDDMSGWEKFRTFLDSNLGSNMNLFNNLPIVSDLIDKFVFKRDDELMWMAAINDFQSAINAYKSFQNGTGGATAYTWIYYGLSGVSNAVGLPFSNAVRESVSVWNTFFADRFGLKRIQTYENTPAEGAEAFYAALESGDAEMAAFYLERAEISGVDTGKMMDKFANLVGEGYISGEIDSDTASEWLIDYADEEADDVNADINAWNYTKETGLKLGNLKDDYMAGLMTHDEAVDYQMRYKGKSAEDAEAIVSEWDYTSVTGGEWDDLGSDYAAGRITRAEAERYLRDYGGMDDDEVTERMDQFDYVAETGNPANTYTYYWRMYDAIENGEDYMPYVRQYFAAGKQKDWIASSITARYKDDYLAAYGTPAADAILERILDLYAAIGYDRASKRRSILRNWVPETQRA